MAITDTYSGQQESLYSNDTNDKKSSFSSNNSQAW